MQVPAVSALEASKSTAFERAWRDLAPKVQAYACRHVGVEAAQDIVAETFLVAWRHWDHPPSDPLPWLLVVARNTIANQRRALRRSWALSAQLANLARLAAPADAVDVSAAQREEALGALARLSEREREAVLLAAWDGLTPGQAALVAGCSVGAFKVRLSRARSRLTDLTADPDREPDPSQQPIVEEAGDVRR